jgi:hypothetical protein
MNRRVVLGVLLPAALALLAPALYTQAAPGGGGGGGTGTIVGEAVSPVYGGIGGATVLLFRAGTIDQVAQTVTDADGYFTFRRVPTGDYTVTVTSLNPNCSGSSSFTVRSRQQIIVVVGMNCQ